MSEIVIDRPPSVIFPVHLALRAIVAHLHDRQIPYAIIGGMAVFAHGYRRTTTNTDVLLSPDAVKAVLI